jgi:nicastrin
MSGVIATLLAARQLKEKGALGDLEKQIIFTYFTGEAYGYIGSTRFVNDIMSFECKERNDKTGACKNPIAPSLAFQNIKMDKIAGIIEVDQVGNTQVDQKPDGTWYIHRERTAPFPAQTKLDAAIEKAANVFYFLFFLQ